MKSLKLRFWTWVHDILERSWHWVYRTKLDGKYPYAYFETKTGTTTLYWSHQKGDLQEYPKMELASVDYYRVNPDGSYTLLDGPTDTAVIR